MKKIIGLFCCVAIGTFFFVQAVSTTDYRGFVLTKSLKLKDACCTLVELEHAKTGAQVLHIQNDDPENFFAICFRTHPTKSNGVAHVLEHSAVQGSEKFPVKNVFFHMTKRSFATFMNALTGHDYTLYPASSECPEDFYNLLDVYTDAVFHPLLTKTCFSQEGHRFEFETFDDPTTPLSYKGVVYNEMKGSLTSPQIRMMRAITKELFPDAMGDVFSGGDPAVITDLTHEELLTFHKDHYAASNCLFFFYGNLPLEKHLDFLADKVLTSDVKAHAVKDRPKQPRFTAARSASYEYPATESEANEEDRSIISVNWLTASLDQDEDCLALRVLDHILMSSDAAPLKHELLGSGLCKEADSYVDTSKGQLPFIIYFEGCKAQNAQIIEELILATLKNIADEGISQDMVERTLSKMELEVCELKKGKGPVGMSYLSSVAVAKMHGGLPENALIMHEQLQKLKVNIQKNPGYLSAIIQKYLLDNPHRVCVVLKPSADLASLEKEHEIQKLAEIKKNLTAQEIDDILLVSKEIRNIQNDVAILPTVTLNSVSLDVPQYPLERSTSGILDVFYHPSFTNHITYATLEFPVPELESDDLWLLGLYSYLLPQLGTKERSYRDNLNLIHEHTGGISAAIMTHYAPSGSYPAFKITGKALNRKANILFDLLYDTITSANFADKERIRQLIIKHVSEIEVSIKNSALDYATDASLSHLSNENYISSHVDGIGYAFKVLQLAQSLESKLDAVIFKLQSLQKRLLPQTKAHLILACDKEAYKTFEAAKFGRLSKLPLAEMRPWVFTCCLPNAVSSYHPISSQVAFNARSFRTISSKHPDSAYVLLGAFLMSNKYLHSRVREQGGAYGAGASYEAISGNFSFKSYRDPNIASTNEAFYEAVNQLCEGHFTEEDVQKAKIGLVQRLDVPLHPSTKAHLGHLLFCDDISEQERKEFRRKILTASIKDIQSAAIEHIACGFNQSVLVTLASKDLLEQENIKLVTPLLQYEVAQCNQHNQ